MKNETEIRNKGMNALVAGLGRDDAQTFLKLMANDRGDYTKWRKYLFHGLTVEEINAEAVNLWKENQITDKVS